VNFGAAQQHRPTPSHIPNRRLKRHAPKILRRLREWQGRTGDKQPLEVTNAEPKAIRYDDFIRQPDQWQPEWIVDKYF